MSPVRTTALPYACVNEPVLIVGGRNSRGERPLGRTSEADDDEGLRCARRKGAGESFANVAGGNERADGTVAELAIAIDRGLEEKRAVRLWN